ncbi:hypothetical protein EBQ26_11820 [Allofranklinella schreckenbergeri]|uniref:Uncharacterized protein n=1 Tax=Allofranklinella schreckenbergeri TaxID=1076744 RepID=A0A3M6PW41_9BURK|nr:hypothetical protein [Allofranklinella schreckenbergeri]RMW95035.1 hypothetical protein EBQ26_11820 [Allofranklinella schreckenbergeri]
MKKNVFALSVATALAALAGSANAQVPFIQPDAGTVSAGNVVATEFRVNDGGIGHVLLQPYYTVQGARNTLLNVTNTDTKNGKAVKVRFRGARNSDDVFDFYVFLSPGDVWRSRVYRDGERTYLDSSDTSCTLPGADVIKNTAFKTVRVFNDLESEVREGYVELLTAADIPPGSALYKSIKHDRMTGKVSCNLPQLIDSTVRLTDLDTARKNGLDFPTAGLVGQWAIVDVSKNNAVSGNATALVATDAKGVPGAGSIVVAPQDSVVAPLAWTDVTSPVLGTTDPLLTKGSVQAQNFDFPDLSTPYVKYAPTTRTPAGHQANELSAALAVSKVVNDFSTGMGVDLKTDWVFSMPTRRYGVAIDYATNTPVENSESAFFQLAGGANRAGNVRFEVENGIPHLSIALNGSYFDNNERQLQPEVSPARIQRLAGEVNVLTFNGNPADSVLGAQIAAQRVNPKLGTESIAEGWASISLENSVALANGYRSALPVVGYASFTAGSAALGFTFPHRYSR